MNEELPVPDKIQAKLQALGLSGIGAVLLEGLAPLAPLGAQCAYILQPMMNQGVALSLRELADWLEQPEEVQAFAHRLRKESR